MKIAITGSSGLIGPALVQQLRADGHDVLRLVRRAAAAPDEVEWNPRPTMDGSGIGTAALVALESTDAVVNLAGAPLISHRWTRAYKAEIRASRVDGTRALAGALAGLHRRPAVLLSGSATGWYGNTGDRAVDESAPGGAGFLAGVARDWEASTDAAERAGIRVVHLRTGIVLSRRGGMLGALLPPFRFGLGARLGSGRQYISWIMLTDVVRAISFLLDRADLAGPVNLTAPNPVTNAAFSSALAAAVHRPAIFRLPSPILRAALGEAATEILTSARVLPARLGEAGYSFCHPGLAAALAAEVAGP